MANQVLYRKWRPQTLGDVAGQEHVTRTILNAVSSGRIAHAYLFTGPRGTGKTSTARILAKAVNCQNPVNGEPDDSCAYCRAVAEGRAMDLVEIDAASNRGIDDIREIRDRVGFMPGEGRFRVYVIDEVHMLTTPAFNALLKTLEEPPPHAIFVLATTDPQNVPATIVSRCQRFDFKRINQPALIGRLRQVCAAEGFAVEDAALELIGRASQGGLRDALNLLEQLTVVHGNQVSLRQAQELLGLTGDPRALEVVRAVLDRSVPDGLRLINQVSLDGVDLRQFTRELVDYLRGAVLIKAGTPEVVDLPGEAVTQLEGLASEATLDDLSRALRLFTGLDFRQEHRPAIALELALLDFALDLTANRAAAAAPPRRREPVAAAASVNGRAAALESAGPAAAAVAAAPPGVTVLEPSTDSVDPEDDSGLTVAEVQRALKRVIVPTSVPGNKLIESLLKTYVSVERVEGNTAVLGFRHPNWMEKINTPEARRASGAALSAVLGSTVEVICVEVKEPAPRGHLVKALLDKGFRIVDEQGREPS